MHCTRRWASTWALFPLLALGCLGQPAQSAASQPATPNEAANATTVSVGLQHALDGLQSAVGTLDTTNMKLPQSEKQAVADSQASIARNLQEAVPGLISAYAAQPNNVGAAFRLYRDVDAVLTVSERTHDALPAGQATDLASANQALRDQLDQLGDWIESRATAQYAQLEAKPAQAKPQAAGPPSTLVIGNANTAATSSKPAKKKPPAPTIPHT